MSIDRAEQKAQASRHAPSHDRTDEAGAPDYTGRIGSFEVEVREGASGSLLLRPDDGHALELQVDGDTLRIRWDGRALRLDAPEADLRMGARNIELHGEDSVAISAGREVDIHSKADVEVRADHHVNLWGHGVRVGD